MKKYHTYLVVFGEQFLDREYFKKQFKETSPGWIITHIFGYLYYLYANLTLDEMTQMLTATNRNFTLQEIGNDTFIRFRLGDKGRDALIAHAATLKKLKRKILENEQKEILVEQEKKIQEKEKQELDETFANSPIAELIT